MLPYAPGNMTFDMIHRMISLLSNVELNPSYGLHMRAEVTVI